MKLFEIEVPENNEVPHTKAGDCACLCGISSGGGGGGATPK